jgi:transcriptional regulator with XRE-family HTH domain
MKGQPKKRKVPGLMRAVLGRNIKLRMEVRYHDKTNKPKELATATGMSLSTVQRIMAGKTGVTLDNLEALAGALDLSAYQLLLPILDSKAPQLVKGAAEEEQRLFRLWKRGRLESTDSFAPIRRV